MSTDALKLTSSSSIASNVGNSSDSIVLEEEIDPNYIPSQEEITEYAKWLGMDLAKDQDLIWIAREGLMAPLPKDWKPCKTKDTDDIYYFNFSTGESTWDHPCDGYYKKLYEEKKKKKEISLKESTDEKKLKAKQDVEKLIGKPGKKKRNQSPSPLGLKENSPLMSSLKSVNLDKKPLPSIILKDDSIEEIQLSTKSEGGKSKLLSRFSDAVDSSSQLNRLSDQKDKTKTSKADDKRESVSPHHFPSFRNDSSISTINDRDEKPQDNQNSLAGLSRLTKEKESISKTKFPTPINDNYHAKHERDLNDKQIHVLERKIQELEETVRIKSKAYDSLKSESDKLQRKLDRLENIAKDYEKLSRDHEDLKNSFTKSKKDFEEDLEKERSNLQAAKREGIEFKTRVTYLESELQSARSYMSQLVEESKSQDSSIIGRSTSFVPSITVSSDSLRINDLENQLEFSKNEVIFTKNEFKKLYDEKSSLLMDMEKLKETSEATIKAERAMSAKLELEIRDLKGMSSLNYQDKLTLITELTDKLAKTELELNDVRVTSQELMMEILKLRNNQEDIKKEKDILQSKNYALASENQDLQKALEDAKILNARADDEEERKPSERMIDNLISAQDNPTVAENTQPANESDILLEQRMAFEQKIEYLENTLKETQTNQRILEDTISKNVEERNELERKIKNLETVLSERNQSLQNLQETLRKENLNHRDEMQRLNTHINIIQIEKENMITQFNAVQANLDLKCTETDLLKQQLHENNRLLVVDEMNDQTSIDDNLIPLKKRIELLEVDKSDLKSKNIKNSLEISALNRTIDSQNAQIEQLENKLSLMNLELIQSKEELLKKSETIATLQRERDDPVSIQYPSSNDISETLFQLNAELATKNQSIQALEIKLHQLKAQVSQLEEISKHWKDQLNVAENEKSMLQTKLQQQEFNISKLQNDLILANQKYGHLEELLRTSNESKESATVFKMNIENALNDKIQRLTNENDQLSIAYRTLESQHRELSLEEEFNVVARDKSSLAEQCLYLNDIITKLRSELALSKEAKQLETLALPPSIVKEPILDRDSDRLIEIGRMLSQQQAVVQRLEAKIDGTEKIVASLNIDSDRRKRVDKALLSSDELSSPIEEIGSSDDYTESKFNADQNVKMIRKKKKEENSVDSYYAKKLDKEVKFLDALRLKQQRQRKHLKDDQKELALVKNKSKQSSRRSMSAREYNRKVTVLNKEIGEWKAMNDWIEDRQNKLTNIEILIEKLKSKNSKNIETLIRSLFQDLDEKNSFFGKPFLQSDDTPSSELEYLSELSVRKPILFQRQRSKSVPHFYPVDYDIPDVSPQISHPYRSMNIPSFHMPVSRQYGLNIRSELRDIGSEQKKREEAYENHANWLLSLGRELGAFHSYKENYNPVQSKGLSEKLSDEN